MTYETLKLDIDSGVATLTLNRPEKRNCMSPQMHIEMTQMLEDLRYNDDVRVVVLTGAGPSFCAGMDLKEFFIGLKDNPREYDRITRLAVEWRYRTLRYHPKIFIAMVNGFCFGGAFSIVEGCDLAIAADEATFGLSEINFKMFPGGSVSKSIANLLSPRDAMWYALTGYTFDGKEAAKIGFVNRNVPLAELQEQTMQVARDIAAKDAVALRAVKDAYRFSLEMSADASMNFTSAKEAQVTLLQNDAWKSEGIGEFMKKTYRPGLGGVEQAGKK